MNIHLLILLCAVIAAPTPRIAGVHDFGIVLRTGEGPDGCDRFGAREPFVLADGRHYRLFYDGLGPEGPMACLATSDDLIHWLRCGPILKRGAKGAPDSACACSPWVIRDGDVWQMFYVGSRRVNPPPDCLAHTPLATMRATAPSSAGPWTRRDDLAGISPIRGTWFDASATPGAIIRTARGYEMFISGSSGHSSPMNRTVGLTWTRNLSEPWRSLEPILPASEQVENASIWHDEASGMWYLFVNHVTDPYWWRPASAVRLYWSRDYRRWNPLDKAVVLDGSNCAWAPHLGIGMATVIQVGQRLAMVYDAQPDNGPRSIGLAWIDLPIHLR
jgi:predicted GH43/DUF377 family glycosyl hydrolase